jgi:RimJ/RimL family protein N-acetyltransferase
MIDIPRIQTERLILRAPLESDLPAMNDYLSKDRMSFIGGPFDDVSAWRALLGTLGHWNLRGFGFWHLEHRESGKMAGAVGFLHHFDWPETELGWNVHHDFEGQGIAHEAALAARKYGQAHLNLDGVISFIDPANTRSAALAKRLGATFEKTYCLRGHDCHIYRHPQSDPQQPENDQ